jgi:hypothetical protein
MNSIDQALATFEPISLDGANDIAALQTRIDRKYLVTESMLWQLLDSFAPTVRVLEIEGQGPTWREREDKNCLLP